MMTKWVALFSTRFALLVSQVTWVNAKRSILLTIYGFLMFLEKNTSSKPLHFHIMIFESHTLFFLQACHAGSQPLLVTAGKGAPGVLFRRDVDRLGGTGFLPAFCSVFSPSPAGRGSLTLQTLVLLVGAPKRLSINLINFLCLRQVLRLVSAFVFRADALKIS